MGSVGKASAGKTFDLEATRTVAFSEATGKQIWAIPGEYQCGGQDGLRGPYLCRMTGTASTTAAGTLTTSKDATLTLQGFDPATGRITWHLEVGGLTESTRRRDCPRSESDPVSSLRAT